MSRSDTVRKTRETSVGWMIQRLSRDLDEMMAQVLDPVGLTHQQFAVLMMIMEFEAPTQTDIGERFCMPAYAISRALDGLEQSGLARRFPDPESRRTHRIHPTDKARAMFDELREIIARVNSELTASLSDSERAQLSGLLMRMVQDRGRDL